MKKYFLLIALFVSSITFGQLTPIQVTARIDTNVFQNNQKRIRGDSLNDVLHYILNAYHAPALVGNKVIAGGTVTWITGYTYEVSPAIYVINDTLYSSLTTSVTLDAADATDDRIDLFVLTTSSTATDVTGTPAATPVEPDINASTQLKISFALVTAASTQPTILNTWIYQENAGSPAEWVYSDNSANLNPASTNNPYAGTIDIEGTTVGTGNQFIMTPTTFPSLVNYNAVVFKIRSKAAWGNQRRILIQFMNGSTLVGTSISFGNGAYGYNSSATGAYQNIAIPLIDFGNISGATALRFQASMTSGTIGFYIDDIQLTGISVVNVVTGAPHEITYYGANGVETSDPEFYRNRTTHETYIQHSLSASTGTWQASMGINADTSGNPFAFMQLVTRTDNNGLINIDSATIRIECQNAVNDTVRSTKIYIDSDSLGFKFFKDPPSTTESYYFPSDSGGAGQVMVSRGDAKKMVWQTITSGVYTPTLTNVTNIAASTPFECQWLRVDSTVTVSGQVDVDATAALPSELGISLPIASNFTANNELGGTAASDAAASLSARIRADAGNNRAAFVFSAVSLGNDSYSFEFTYRIK